LRPEDALIRFDTILKFRKPAKRTWKVIKTWFSPWESTRFNQKHRPIFADKSAMNNAFSDDDKRKDSLSLHGAANDDRVTRALSKWRWFTNLGRVSFCPS
jgi:hypothetical protein